MSRIKEHSSARTLDLFSSCQDESQLVSVAIVIVKQLDFVDSMREQYVRMSVWAE